MNPYYQYEQVTVHGGDCLDILKTLADNSIDAVVTDPPYGLEFMGKDWDRFGPNRDPRTAGRAGAGAITAGAGIGDDDRNPASRSHAAFGITKPSTWRCDTCNKRDQFRNYSPKVPNCQGTWLREPIYEGAPRQLLAYQAWCLRWAAECLRVLKPGGHLLAFGGTRTWHRLAGAIEDAGFEIRDSIAWLYGSGFPKSLDVSKAIDRVRDDYPAIKTVIEFIRAALAASDKSRTDMEETLGGTAVAAHFLAPSRSNAGCPSWEQWLILKDLLSFGDDMDAEVWTLNGRKGKPGTAWEQREVIGKGQAGLGGNGNGAAHDGGYGMEYAITAPATDAAKQWQGWGTALKPAFEPIVVARKPLVGTVAANVAAYGTGALNIDACRVGTDTSRGDRYNGKPSDGSKSLDDGAEDWNRIKHRTTWEVPAGRWPANVVLDEHQAAELDKQSGTLASRGNIRPSATGASSWFADQDPSAVTNYDNGGGASRFFPVFRYTAKAATTERPTADGIAHPTVKPLDLMRWLIRLVTPPGGTVLDPFAGSGTTGEAAIHEHKHAILIEREPTYLPLIVARLSKPMAVGFNFEEPA